MTETNLKRFYYNRKYLYDVIIPYAYDNGLTYYEQLLRLARKIDEIGIALNVISKELDEMIAWINENLELIAREVLQQFIDDGTIAKIINEELFEELNAKIDLIAFKQTDLEENISKLQSDIEENISKLQSDIMNTNNITSKNSILNGRYVLIGDSICTGNNKNGWGYIFKNYIGESKVYLNGLSGSGFTTSNSFLKLLTDLSDNMTIDEKNTITHVITLGGINDRGNSNVGNSVFEYNTYALNNFPNAKIITLPLNTFGTLTNINLNTYRDISLYTIGKRCVSSDIFITLLGGYREYERDNDNTHLTDDGYNFLCYQLISFIQNGSVATFKSISKENFGFISPFNFTSFNCYVLNGRVTIEGIADVTNFSGSGIVTIGNTPRSIKPSTDHVVTANTINLSTGKNVPLYCRINTNGRISLDYMTISDVMSKISFKFDYLATE